MFSKISQEKLKKAFKNPYITYTFLYPILFFCCIGVWFGIHNRCFVWKFDGLTTHYTQFLYTGKYFRSIIKGIASGRFSGFPTWDYGIGYGSDILSTLGVGFWDPFNIFSIIIPSKYSELAYDAVVFLKMYLAGISFCAFCRARKHGNLQTLSGAIIYTFSATLYIAFKHPNFIDVFYLFPFVMIGVDELWLKPVSKTYMIALGLCFLEFFYFAYMAVILIVAYCLLRFLITNIIYKSDHNRFVPLILRFSWHSVLGVGMALFGFWPVVLNIARTDRLDFEYIIPLFYDKVHNRNLFLSAISYFDNGNDTFIGMSAICLLFLFLFFMLRNSHLLKVCLALMGIGICLPYAGHVLNGFSYASNRWIFAMMFAIAYASVILVERFEELTIRNTVGAALLSAVYAFVAIWGLGARTKEYLFSASLLLCLSILLVICQARSMQGNAMRMFLLGLSCISVIGSSFCFWRGGLMGTEMPKGSVYPTIAGSGEYPMIARYKMPETMLRFNSYGLYNTLNASWSMMHGISALDYYQSFYKNNVDKYHKKMALNTDPFCFLYNGLDRRAELMYLNGVQYYTGMDGSQPYGYAGIGDTDNAQLFKTAGACGGAYYYEYAVPYREYDSLKALDRQQLLCKAIAVEEGYANYSVEEAGLNDNRISAFQISENSEVTFDGHTFSVPANGAKLELTFKPVTDAELYVYFENLQVSDQNVTTYTIDINAFRNGEWVSFSNGRFYAMTNRSQFYGAKHDWLIHLGYRATNADSILIEFQSAGEYTVDDFGVYCRPQQEIKSNLDLLNPVDAPLQCKTNRMQIYTDRDRAGYLYLSMPYSEGWCAYIDGEQTEIIKANDAFMAVWLTAGEHDVVFRYRSPFFREGLLLSFACFIVTMIVFHHYKKVKNHETA